MKKFLIMLLLISPLIRLSAQAREEVPILPLDRGVDIQYSDTNLDLINVDKMKRGKTVQKAKDELKEKSTSPIQVDNRYLQHQRALDYVTNPNRYMMPPVL